MEREVYNPETGQYEFYNPEDDYRADEMPIAPAPVPQWNQWGIPPNSNQPVGTMDLSYWLSRGVTPDQIFDEHGQPRPGWTRTARGYEQVNTPQPSAPTAGPVGGPVARPASGPTGGTGDAAAQYSSAGFQWPEFNAPRMGSLPPFTYQDFSYQDFQAPTIEQARNEPGFQHALQTGQQALENAAAARGTLRTGGTMKDLITWGQKAADQNYGNVYARAADTYDRNRGNAFGSWSGNLQKELSARGINWGEMTDTYDRNAQAAKDEFNPKFRAAELTFGDLFNRWKASGDWTRDLALGVD